MVNYLLEIRTEEIPACLIKGALNELLEKIKKQLDKDGIFWDDIKMMGTPRRMTMIISGLSLVTKPVYVEIKGPDIKVAYNEFKEPTKALLGFCKDKGINLGDISRKTIKDIEYIYIKKTIPGIETKILLPSIIEKVLNSMHFPKMMHWGNEKIAFIRPVRSIISIFDNQPLTIEFAGIKSSNITVGHRFLSKDNIKITNVELYESILEKEYVICNIEKRRNLILKGISEEEKKVGGKFISSNKLFEEILFLVEHPTVFTGSFSKEYLKLPKEIVMLTMIKHQKYFPLENNNGDLLPNFIGVRCGDDHAINTVIKGNEKVLIARLEDVKFFFEEDQKIPLNSLIGKLNYVVFQEQLGTIGNKVQRITEISEYIGNQLNFKEIAEIKETAILCKCDLETQMVYEFPELQGKIGRYYSEIEGVKSLVSIGIEEHYKPIFAGDSVAKTITGISVAIADKIDTVVGMIGIGLIPTGSQDPYALRRHTLGIIRTLIENKLHLSLKELVLKVKILYGSILKELAIEDVLDFFRLRLKVILEKELSYDLVDSILKGDIDDVYSVYLKALDLKNFSQSESFKDLIEVLKRSKNILKKQKKVSVIFSENLFKNDFERALGRKVTLLKRNFFEALKKQEYREAMTIFANLKKEMAEFFENVVVMVDEEKVKNNRLGLLGTILKMGDQLFDIESIVI